MTEFYQSNTMSRTDSLKQQYLKDADAMASKSRFGFFTLPPSHTAASGQSTNPRPLKGEDGRVVTSPRNIFSGSTSTPQLQKNFFSYTPSAFHGSEFQDPGKHERLQHLADSKKEEGKDIFKPVKVQKTLLSMSASYAYMSPSDPKQGTKNHRDHDGRVITQPPNIQSNLQSKITYGQDKQFKYKECPPTEKVKVAESGPEDAFKTGNPNKHVFTSNVQTYFDTNLPRQESKKSIVRSASHEGPFKPSCIAKKKPFEKLVYKEEGVSESKRPQKKENEVKAEPFRLLKVEKNTRPSPSIALTKVNMLRVCR